MRNLLRPHVTFRTDKYPTRTRSFPGKQCERTTRRHKIKLELTEDLTERSSISSDITGQCHCAAERRLSSAVWGSGSSECSGSSILFKLGQRYLKFLPTPLAFFLPLALSVFLPPFRLFPPLLNLHQGCVLRASAVCKTALPLLKPQDDRNYCH